MEGKQNKDVSQPERRAQNKIKSPSLSSSSTSSWALLIIHNTRPNIARFPLFADSHNRGVKNLSSAALVLLERIPLSHFQTGQRKHKNNETLNEKLNSIQNILFLFFFNSFKAKLILAPFLLDCKIQQQQQQLTASGSPLLIIEIVFVFYSKELLFLQRKEK